MKLYSFPTYERMSSAAFEAVADIACAAIAERGVFTIALSGGSAPQGLYRLFGEQSGNRFPAWRNIHVFFGDERCVPPEHEDSNYRMARELFLDGIDIPDENVHRIYGELSPNEAAARYSDELAAFFGRHGLFMDGKPAFDLLLLGMGPDGHTASLFPGSRALDAVDSSAIATEAGPGFEPRDRISLSLPLLNNAGTVMFLVSGESKRALIESIFVKETERTLPAARVKPRGRLSCYCDFTLP